MLANAGIGHAVLCDSGHSSLSAEAKARLVSQFEFSDSCRMAPDDLFWAYDRIEPINV
jgi:hypothetical protein